MASLAALAQFMFSSKKDCGGFSRSALFFKLTLSFVDGAGTSNSRDDDTKDFFEHDADENEDTKGRQSKIVIECFILPTRCDAPRGCTATNACLFSYGRSSQSAAMSAD